MTDARNCAEALLTDLEAQLARVDSGLLAADPVALRGACAELRHGALAFAHAVEASLDVARIDPALRRRIERVAQRLSSQRTSLARRSVIVERSLASILGPQPNATYSVPGGRMAFGAADLH